MTERASRPARSVPVLIGADEMARIDEGAVRLGISPDALMESAGAAVTELAHAELARLNEPMRGPSGPLAQEPLTAVLCGPGNNGGDGFVVARRLAAAGRRVLAVLVADAGRIDAQPSAAHNWGVLQAMASAGSLELFVAPRPEMLLELRDRLRGATLLVDALLGSGAAGQLREPISTAVDLINAVRSHARADGRPCSVLAIDAPTRIDLTGGSRSEPVIAADLTVTFHRAKAGFALDREARRLAGRYFVAPIGIPLEAEAGIVPDDGEHPPARITQVTWEEPVEHPAAAHRPGGGVGAGPGVDD